MEKRIRCDLCGGPTEVRKVDSTGEKIVTCASRNHTSKECIELGIKRCGYARRLNGKEESDNATVIY